ncbi:MULTISPECIES: LysR family transcriptional regulator [unclassified Roseitalea]|uniref:LysR family transcriptional regulator n=1 Tax=unclassified Roseitalea TaxID=2639107 RepID=UPI00273D9F62|nr:MULTISPECIES: LysR family transcriptional regulator [unclassified Roseitalea]
MMHAAVLRYFVAVARAGSIRKASEELHVAASAISRQIMKMEEDLGMPLFERLPAGLKLTSAGRAAMEHAERTLNDYEILKSDLGALRGHKTGTVKIATLDSLLVDFIPDQLLAFHARNPNVDFQVRSAAHGRIVHHVAEGEADIGITFDLARSQDLDFIGAVPMPLMAMVASNHRLARAEAVTLTECAQFNLFLQLDTEPIRSFIDIELSMLQRTGRVLVASNNLNMIKPLIMAGVGVAFYTPLGMAREIREGKIVGVPLKGTRLGGLKMGILVPRRRRATHATEAMIDHLCAGLNDVASTCR